VWPFGGLHHFVAGVLRVLGADGGALVAQQFDQHFPHFRQVLDDLRGAVQLVGNLRFCICLWRFFYFFFFFVRVLGIVDFAHEVQQDFRQSRNLVGVFVDGDILKEMVVLFQQFDQLFDIDLLVVVETEKDL
jgi:hypothetical protein